MEYRVQFDFTVHFTNGGSLSATDFRLDIPENAISDDELAAYLIQDMRLLMAGHVDIVHKKIITEAHKRAPINTRDLPRRTIDLRAEDFPASRLVDLAKESVVRIIGDDGESYKLERLVV
jgi:hypothetical protein